MLNALRYLIENFHLGIIYFIFVLSEQSCPHVAIKNGIVLLEGHSMAKYKCDVGYDLSSGDSVRQCLLEKWSGSPPICRSKDALIFVY